jgi:hypothetical protein
MKCCTGARPFHDFCTRRLANLLEQSKQVIQAQYTKSSSEQQSMTSPLSAIVRREPVTCAPETPMRQVLETMNSLGIGSMVAVDPQQRPLGIFTLHDVLSRVTLPNLDLNTPFSAVMSPTRSPCRRTRSPMKRRWSWPGMASAIFWWKKRQADRPAVGKGSVHLQRVGLRQLSGIIRKAADLDTLKHAAEDIRQLAHNMLAQGITAEQLTQIISTLNDLLTTRIIELELEADSRRARSGILLAGAGLGRPPGTDAEYRPGQRHPVQRAGRPDAEASDPRRHAALRQTHQPGPGRMRFSAVQRRSHGVQPEVVPVAGGMEKHLRQMDLPRRADGFAALHHLLRLPAAVRRRPHGRRIARMAGEAAAKNTRFLHQLAVNALRNKPPLGIVRDFVTSDGMIDLKLNGITPFVDAARIFSLAHGVSATNTCNVCAMPARKCACQRRTSTPIATPSCISSCCACACITNNAKPAKNSPTRSIRIRSTRSIAASCAKPSARRASCRPSWRWITRSEHATAARIIWRQTRLSDAQTQKLARWQALPEADLRSPIDASRYVVVDVETSGLNVNKDRLIAIGAVAVVNGKIALATAWKSSCSNKGSATSRTS